MINLIKNFALYVVFVFIVGCTNDRKDDVWEDGGNEYLIVKSTVHINGKIKGAIVYSGGVLNFNGVSNGGIIINEGGKLILGQSPDNQTIIHGLKIVDENSGYVNYFEKNINIIENSGQRIRHQAALSKLSNEFEVLKKINKKLYFLRKKHGLEVDDSFSITFSGNRNVTELIKEYRSLSKKVLAETERVKRELNKLEKNKLDATE